MNSYPYVLSQLSKFSLPEHLLYNMLMHTHTQTLNHTHTHSLRTHTQSWRFYAAQTTRKSEKLAPGAFAIALDRRQTVNVNNIYHLAANACCFNVCAENRSDFAQREKKPLPSFDLRAWRIRKEKPEKWRHSGRWKYCKKIAEFANDIRKIVN